MYILLILYFKNKVGNRTIYMIQMYVMIRSSLRLMDFEQTRQSLGYEYWIVVVILIVCVIQVTQVQFILSFPLTCAHFLVTTLMVFLSTFAIVCAIYGFKEVISGTAKNKFKGNFLIFIPFGAISLLCFLYLLSRNNNFALEGIDDSLQTKEDYKFIINKL